MSRSGYGEDIDHWQLIKWRGAVSSAIKGKRGQAFLKEMLAALDALPRQRLLQNDLIDGTGEVCAIGAVGLARGVDMSQVDPDWPEQLAGTFGIARALVCEIEYVNDEDVPYYKEETPEERFARVRNWVASQIK